jgi:hypothetical protein
LALASFSWLKVDVCCINPFRQKETRRRA